MAKTVEEKRAYARAHYEANKAKYNPARRRANEAAVEAMRKAWAFQKEKQATFAWRLAEKRRPYDKYGVSLSSAMRSVPKGVGSRINWLLKNHTNSLYLESRVGVVDKIMTRVVRDQPMPAKRFAEMLSKCLVRYRINRGPIVANYIHVSQCGIGGVTLSDRTWIYEVDRGIATARDAEFSRKKYKKMDPAQVGFLESLFELNALLKKEI